MQEISRSQSAVNRAEGGHHVGMVHRVHHRCVTDFGGSTQREYRGNAGAVTCDENAGRILRRPVRVERCAKEPGSCR